MYDFNLITSKLENNVEVKKLSTISLAYVFQKKGSRKNKHTARTKILFDTGCGSTIINKKIIGNLKTKKNKFIQNWKTKSGEFQTNMTCNVTFTLPQFHKNREICWEMHVDESNSQHSTYDMIVGRDLMHELGFKIDFQTGRIEWDNAWINMQDPTFFKEDRITEFEEELFLMHDPDTTDAQRIQDVMDAKYAPANLELEVQKITELNLEQKAKLLQLLKKFKPLFSGGLGHWKTDPVDIELKDPGCKPIYQKPYPVPKSQEKRLKDDCKRLCELGI